MVCFVSRKTHRDRQASCEGITGQMATIFQREMCRADAALVRIWLLKESMSNNEHSLCYFCQVKVAVPFLAFPSATLPDVVAVSPLSLSKAFLLDAIDREAVCGCGVNEGQPRTSTSSNCVLSKMRSVDEVRTEHVKTYQSKIT